MPCFLRRSPSQGKVVNVVLKLFMMGVMLAWYRSKRSSLLIDGGAGTLYATSGQKGTSTTRRQTSSNYNDLLSIMYQVQLE